MHRPSLSVNRILAALFGGLSALQQPAIPKAPRGAPNGGRPSGAAAAKRAARKRRNVRARASKR